MAYNVGMYDGGAVTISVDQFVIRLCGFVGVASMVDRLSGREIMQ